MILSIKEKREENKMSTFNAVRKKNSK